jgi:serine/threonine protein kinase
MTRAGVILGTAAYMSPEQAAGKPVDRRSDLWAFGVVLLEMLTGRRVFDGETVSHVLAAVLKEEPDWARLPADTPAPVRRLLRRCLGEPPPVRRHDAAVVVRRRLHERRHRAAPRHFDLHDVETGTAERLTTSPNEQYASGVTPDGTRLLFTQRSPQTGDRHFLQDAVGFDEAHPLARSDGHSDHPRDRTEV